MSGERMLDDAGNPFSGEASSTYKWGALRLETSIKPGKLVPSFAPMRWYATRVEAAGFCKRNMPRGKWGIVRFYP